MEQKRTSSTRRKGAAFQKIKLSTLLLIVAAAVVACLPKSPATNTVTPQNISIYVTVFTDGGQVASKAQVTLGFGDSSPDTKSTDSEGQVGFQIHINDLGRQADVIVQADGYEVYTKTVLISKEGLEIWLTQIPNTTAKETPTTHVLKTPLASSLSGKIAFERGREFFVANPDGSNETLVMDKAGSCPRISPDGKRIAFLQWERFKTDLYMINADGSGITNVSNTVSFDENCAAWSPSGTMLLYARRYSINNDLFLMNGDGTDQQNLTNSDLRGISTEYGYSASPWSPDGSRIVFHARGDLSLLTGDREDLTAPPLSDYDIYTMTVDGADLVQITGDSESDLNHPDDYQAVWSPDGSAIAFVSTGGVGGKGDIYLLDLQRLGRGPINITKNPAHDTDPAWSPDGRRLLFISDRDGNRDILVMNRDGTEIRKITDTSEPEENPYWIP